MPCSYSSIFARLASEILLSSLSSGFFSNLLSRLGKPFIHFFLIGEQLLDARALLHALEMRRDVGKAGDVHLQLGGAAAAPKEMRVRSGEMVEEVLVSGEQIVADPEVLEQSFRREL